MRFDDPKPDMSICYKPAGPEDQELAEEPEDTASMWRAYWKWAFDMQDLMAARARQQARSGRWPPCIRQASVGCWHGLLPALERLQTLIQHFQPSGCRSLCNFAPGSAAAHSCSPCKSKTATCSKARLTCHPCLHNLPVLLQQVSIAAAGPLSAAKPPLV